MEQKMDHLRKFCKNDHQKRMTHRPVQPYFGELKNLLLFHFRAFCWCFHSLNFRFFLAKLTLSADFFSFAQKKIKKLENGTRRAQIPRKPLIFPSPNKQTDKQKNLATQRFELSTLAFLAQCFYGLSYRAVLIWLLLSDYYYQTTIILDLIEIVIQSGSPDNCYQDSTGWPGS